MKSITKQELEAALALHRDWLAGKKDGARLDLSGIAKARKKQAI